MKEYCVIFDTNILTKNKNDLTSIKKKIITMADIFIPRMVIEEIEGQKSRTINDEYSKIKSLIKKNSLYFKYEEKFKLNDILNKNETDIAKWFETYCKNSIIEYEDITLKDITLRAKYKLAPFINKDSSSDKGFKDTVIWLSILKSNKLDSYKQIIFVTNDQAGFVNNIQELYDEYNKEHKNTFVICQDIEQLYTLLKIANEDILNNTSNDSDELSVNVANIKDLKQKINSCVERILYSTYEDNWGNSYSQSTFNIYKKMSEKDMKFFLESLDSFLKENIFFNYLDISDLLIQCGINSAGENVFSDDLIELNQIYLSLKNNKDLYNSFIIFLLKEFNKLYKLIPTKNDASSQISEVELPF